MLKESEWLYSGGLTESDQWRLDVGTERGTGKEWSLNLSREAENRVYGDWETRDGVKKGERKKNKNISAGSYNLLVPYW